jgi:hypothetical protein
MTNSHGYSWQQGMAQVLAGSNASGAPRQQLAGDKQVGAIAAVDYLWNNKLAGGEFSSLGDVGRRCPTLGLWVPKSRSACNRGQVRARAAGHWLVEALAGPVGGAGGARPLLVPKVGEDLVFARARVTKSLWGTQPQFTAPLTTWAP